MGLAGKIREYTTIFVSRNILWYSMLLSSFFHPGRAWLSMKSASLCFSVFLAHSKKNIKRKKQSFCTNSVVFDSRHKISSRDCPQSFQATVWSLPDLNICCKAFNSQFPFNSAYFRQHGSLEHPEVYLGIHNSDEKQKGHVVSLNRKTSSKLRRASWEFQLKKKTKL